MGLIKFWNKRAAAGSRRNNRLIMQRLKQSAVTFGALALFAGSVIYGWATGSFAKAGDWAWRETLTRSAEAGFKVTDILVEGRINTPMRDIQSRLGFSLLTPMLTVDLDKAQAQLADILWIKNVRLARQLPDTIRIEIEERDPIALWQFQKKLSVIDKDGLVLSDGDLSSFSGLPLVIGPDAANAAAELLNLFTAEQDVAAHVVSASRIGARRWDLRLDSGTLVKLPENDLELAFSRLAAAQKKIDIFNKGVAVIDLRLPEKMVLTPGGKMPVASVESSGRT
jgi:cell division protein FtsQ